MTAKSCLVGPNYPCPVSSSVVWLRAVSWRSDIGASSRSASSDAPNKLSTVTWNIMAFESEDNNSPSAIGHIIGLYLALSTMSSSPMSGTHWLSVEVYEGRRTSQSSAGTEFLWLTSWRCSALLVCFGNSTGYGSWDCGLATIIMESFSATLSSWRVDGNPLLPSHWYIRRVLDLRVVHRYSCRSCVLRAW